MATNVNNGFALNMGTPMVSGIITLAAIAILVAMRKGFSGVVIKMGK